MDPVSMLLAACIVVCLFVAVILIQRIADEIFKDFPLD